MTRRKSLLLAVSAGALTVGAVPWAARGSTVAAPSVPSNSPTYRDCSVAAPGVDPDFVALPGVAANGTVPPSTDSVVVEASESSDPGDSAGHVTLTAEVASAGLPTEQATGAHVGKVLLDLPLLGSAPGRAYTISWSATFDNGMHQCPSPVTTNNTAPMPFKVTVTK